MFKPADVFVAVAMTVTAACVAVMASFGLGFGLAEGMLVGLAALAGMAVLHMAFARAPGAELERIDDLDRVVTELQSRIETLDVRLSTLDAAVADRAKAATRPLVEEIAALGGLVTSVAKEVAKHDAALLRLKTPRPAPVATLATPAEALPAQPARVSEPAAHPLAEGRPLIPPPPAPPRKARRTEAAAPPSKPQAPDPFDPAEAEDETQGYAGAADRGLAARVELALRDDRVDFYLQPVVALPNRRILHYEGFSRLREPDGLVLPEEFLPAAAAEGRLVEIDRRAIERAARVAHRLNARGRGVRIFVNIAAETLADDRVARDVATYIDGSPELTRLLVLELTQSAFDGLGALERENRDALAAKGVRFSIDQVSNLRLDGRDLAARGVRFVKVPAATLLDPDTARNLPVHPADLPNLLARDGVDLIATHVEEERTTPELLDLDVKAAQGFLFGVPRPVRGEGGEAGEAGSDGVTRAFTPHAFPRRA
ncbi:cyclic-di-GMP phosphodiesterase TipF (flagellum assembly factor) [Methylopila capsulata]|uniref:Cyclic-di-GMP phosphodiesterase TipF (Flagellum assembly factor) n=1 Tax=Methylopila capsulata TaxID=61654 RepID=A0A9W6IX89_9HYPH|nr:EAL domain-containing protein [Methylopila capsulata]MBM7852574.1 cyclic-di-GMP phosphodiesterase TipF (flagellum assembly factor) [Methylopila capsulata]GLK56781.1 hypothetical protein GCM10008170_28000 [Methylopila capsulata]